MVLFSALLSVSLGYIATCHSNLRPVVLFNTEKTERNDDVAERSCMLSQMNMACSGVGWRLKEECEMGKVTAMPVNMTICLFHKVA